MTTFVNLQSNSFVGTSYATRRDAGSSDEVRRVEAGFDFWREQYSKLSERASLAWNEYDNAIERGRPHSTVKALGDKAERLDVSARNARREWDSCKAEILKLKAGE